MRITIVGAGHGGCAAAAAYSRLGHEVKLLKMQHQVHNDNFEYLRKTKRIRLKGILGEDEVPLADVTADVKTAMKDAELVFVFYVANFHPFLAHKLSPYLESDQLVFLCPGYAGSIFFLNELRQIGCDTRPIFVEGETLPFTSRIVAHGVVDISSRNYGHPIAAIPKATIGTAIDRLSPILGNCFTRANVLETSMHNPNLIMHTTGIILNAGRIESSQGNFVMYIEGFTPSIWKVVERLDQEKMAIIERIGGKRRTYFNEFLVRTYPDPENYTDMDGFRIYAASTASLKTTTINTRYVTEDVPVGLGLMHSLGNHLGIPTPMCDSIIHIASAMMGVDYFAEARTIESLGMNDIRELLDLIQ